jgi:hypothetical protein
MVDRIADEYDVQDLRKHFVTREVADRELGLKIHGHVVTHEYAARGECPTDFGRLLFLTTLMIGFLFVTFGSL